MENFKYIVLAGIFFGLVLFAFNQSYGPDSKNLVDPFEEHEE